MSQKLSFHSIATTLAALSATGLIACGQSVPPAESPAQAKEVPAALPEPVAVAPTVPESQAALQPSADAAPAVAPGAGAALPLSADAAKSQAAAPDASAVPAKPKATIKQKAGAKAGCGAGTCG